MYIMYVCHVCNVRMYVCMDVCMDVCVYVCMYVCAYVCVCMHACTYACIMYAYRSYGWVLPVPNLMLDLLGVHNCLLNLGANYNDANSHAGRAIQRAKCEHNGAHNLRFPLGLGIRFVHCIF